MWLVATLLHNPNTQHQKKQLETEGRPQHPYLLSTLRHLAPACRTLGSCQNGGQMDFTLGWRLL